MLAAGCGSTPASNLYTLSAVPGPAAGSADLSVAVGPCRSPPPSTAPRSSSPWARTRWLDEFNTVREETAGKGYDALAAAHRRALARLSQDIANAVRALDGGGAR